MNSTFYRAYRNLSDNYSIFHCVFHLMPRDRHILTHNSSLPLLPRTGTSHQGRRKRFLDEMQSLVFTLSAGEIPLALVPSLYSVSKGRYTFPSTTASQLCFVAESLVLRHFHCWCHLTHRNPLTLPRNTSRLFLNCVLLTLSKDNFMSLGVS